MDIKIAADKINEEYLKERLVGTEEQLFMAETAANFNSGKVEAMKNDLWALKMSLWFVSQYIYHLKRNKIKCIRALSQSLQQLLKA